MASERNELRMDQSNIGEPDRSAGLRGSRDAAAPSANRLHGSSPPRPLRIACLVSGAGSTMLNLADRIERGVLAARIVLVAAARVGVRAIDEAASRGLPTAVVGPGDGASLDDRLDAALRAAQPDLICLCGYLRLFRVGAWAGRVINIHPGPLPRFGGRGFYGSRVHQAVLDAGLRETACCVHLVDDQYDHGPVIAQRRVPIEPGETVESLERRVREAERELLPEVIGRIASGALALPGAGLS